MRYIVLPTLALALFMTACIAKDDGDKTQINNSVECGDDVVRCIACEPGRLDCDDASLVRCKEDGQGFMLEEPCATLPLCAEGLLTGSCVEPVCTSGDALCVGAIMQICATGRNRYDLIACESEDACLRGLSMRSCAAVECSESSDCTGEDTQCRRRICESGDCGIENLPEDTACTIGDVNGMCDGVGACNPTDQCVIASDCAGSDTECRIRVCVEGACGFANLPESTVCTTTSVNGECNGEGACLPISECTISSDCPGEDTQCRVRACVQSACGFADLPEMSPCDVDGLGGSCDGMGTCVQTAACATANDCSGQDTDCRIRACEDGVCSFSDLELTTPCSVNGFGGECDGEGACVQTQQCQSAADCPVEQNPCRQAVCSGGRCSTRSSTGSCQMGDSVGECSGGACRCPTNTRFCANRCVATINDPEHCGSCNNQCDVEHGEVCDRSSCGCPDNYWNCNGTCVDLRLDGNCGGCGDVCPSGAQCLRGCGGNAGPGCECAGGFFRCSNFNSTCLRPGTPEWEENNCNGDCGTCGQCVSPI